MKNNINLTGTGVAIVTPFTVKNKVDYVGLKKLIQHVIRGGIDYIVVMGTTGESTALTPEERADVIKFVAQEVYGRVPLVVGIGGNNTAEVIKQVRAVDPDQFSAILSVSPSYNKPSQEGIYKHYKELAKASALPIILYNVPSRTGSSLTWETVIQLAHDCKNIIGIKEASGNSELCRKIIHHKPDNFFLISGDDTLTLPLIACGACGVISVSANAFPKNISDMTRSALRHDFTKAQKLDGTLLEITEQLFMDGNPSGIKYLLSILGITEKYVRLPLVEPCKDVQQKIKSIVSKTKKKVK
jgi:4-hydroxy-tetrahydrodipicolinate synthase